VIKITYKIILLDLMIKKIDNYPS